MGYLYVLDDFATIGIDSNYIVVKKKNGEITKVPSQTLESISIFGTANLSMQCMKHCMLHGIPVSFYSKGGKYFGKLMSTGHISVERQRKQDKLYGTEFSLNFSKRIIKAKMHNQLVVLKRYAKSKEKDIYQEAIQMKNLEKKIDLCENINQIMGYEGNCARIYFSVLGTLVNTEFQFTKRSRRPPLDEFNSMISLGYSMIMNEIYGKIENRGLNPYFGFLHQDREKHPTLVSDLMEEWRAVIVDSMVMSLINGNEISKECFYHDVDTPGIFLTHDALRIFINKLEKKMETNSHYLQYVSYAVSFRRAMELQVDSLVRAIEKEDVNEYEPIQIR